MHGNTVFLVGLLLVAGRVSGFSVRSVTSGIIAIDNESDEAVDPSFRDDERSELLLFEDDDQQRAFDVDDLFRDYEDELASVYRDGDDSARSELSTPSKYRSDVEEQARNSDLVDSVRKGAIAAPAASKRQAVFFPKSNDIEDAIRAAAAGAAAAASKRQAVFFPKSNDIEDAIRAAAAGAAAAASKRQAVFFPKSNDIEDAIRAAAAGAAAAASKRQAVFFPKSNDIEESMRAFPETGPASANRQAVFFPKSNDVEDAIRSAAAAAGAASSRSDMGRSDEIENAIRAAAAAAVAVASRRRFGMGRSDDIENAIRAAAAAAGAASSRSDDIESAIRAAAAAAGAVSSRSDDIENAIRAAAAAAGAASSRSDDIEDAIRSAAAAAGVATSRGSEMERLSEIEDALRLYDVRSETTGTVEDVYDTASTSMSSAVTENADNAATDVVTDENMAAPSSLGRSNLLSNPMYYRGAAAAAAAAGHGGAAAGAAAAGRSMGTRFYPVYRAGAPSMRFQDKRYFPYQMQRSVPSGRSASSGRSNPDNYTVDLYYRSGRSNAPFNASQLGMVRSWNKWGFRNPAERRSTLTASYRLG